MSHWRSLFRSLRLKPALWGTQYTHKPINLRKLSSRQQPPCENHDQVFGKAKGEAVAPKEEKDPDPWDGTEYDGRIKNPPEENLFSTWKDNSGYFAFAAPGRVVTDYTFIRKVRGIESRFATTHPF
jgi:hypothetical protein